MESFENITALSIVMFVVASLLKIIANKMSNKDAECVLHTKVNTEIKKKLEDLDSKITTMHDDVISIKRRG